jgi:hypothetical protein
VTETDNLPILPSDANLGLEDFDTSRMVIPRLTIDHKGAAFVDSLTQEQYPGSIDLIILGMVKQRILWHVTPGDKGELPLCKSPDYEHGFPTDIEILPKGKAFPWDTSGFNPTDYPAESGINGLRTLSCANCGLKEWGSHPLGNKPYCGEMYTFPSMYTPRNADPGTFVPALLSIRSTGLKAANAYISRFFSTKTPMFTVWTRVRLDVTTRSGNSFCIPNFQTTDPSPREWWAEFANTFRGIRETIRRAPMNSENIEDDTVTVTTPTAPAAAAPPAATPAPARVVAPVAVARPVTPVPAVPVPTPVATVPSGPVPDDDDELPF